MPKYERIEEGWGFAAVLILNGRFITNTKFCNSKKKKDENISALHRVNEKKSEKGPPAKGLLKSPPLQRKETRKQNW